MCAKWDDHFTRRARQLGYPARSVFKLQEIERRAKVLPKTGRVLDLGAAPGSWTLFSLKQSRAHVLAVDLQPISLSGSWGDRLETIRGDLFSTEVLSAIVSSGPFDTVLSDAAPATSGQRVRDSAASAELVARVIEIGAKTLKPGGNLVAKIFQGGEEQGLMVDLRGRFATVRALKPEASRKGSSEVFLIGLGYAG